MLPRFRALVAALVACAAIELHAEEVVTQPIRTFGLGSLSSAAYSPDGRYIATCGGEGAFLWEIETGSVIRTFRGHTGVVYSVAFSPDGTKVLTGIYDRTAKQWETATGNCIRTFSGHTDCVHSVAFSPDGTMVLTGSVDNTAKLWDALPHFILTVVGGSGSGVYDRGTVVAISAQAPPPGYRFDRWTGDTTNVANVSSASTTVTMLADATVTATFAVARRISGTVWNDLNGNATRDTGEPGLQPWVVYLDQNLNGKIDPGESSQTTDSNGCYAFTDLGPGSYIVAHVVPPGWMQTYPATPAHIVVLTAEQDAENINFGCQPKQQADVNGDGCSTPRNEPSTRRRTFPPPRHPPHFSSGVCTSAGMANPPSP